MPYPSIHQFLRDPVVDLPGEPLPLLGGGQRPDLVEQQRRLEPQRRTARARLRISDRSRAGSRPAPAASMHHQPDRAPARDQRHDQRRPCPPRHRTRRRPARPPAWLAQASASGPSRRRGGSASRRRCRPTGRAPPAGRRRWRTSTAAGVVGLSRCATVLQQVARRRPPGRRPPGSWRATVRSWVSSGWPRRTAGVTGPARGARGRGASTRRAGRPAPPGAATGRWRSCRRARPRGRRRARTGPPAGWCAAAPADSTTGTTPRDEPAGEGGARPVGKDRRAAPPVRSTATAAIAASAATAARGDLGGPSTTVETPAAAARATNQASAADWGGAAIASTRPRTSSATRTMSRDARSGQGEVGVQRSAPSAVDRRPGEWVRPSVPPPE